MRLALILLSPQKNYHTAIIHKRIEPKEGKTYFYSKFTACGQLPHLMGKLGLFGVIAPTLRAAIKSIYRSDTLKEYREQKYIRLENSYSADVYSLPMIVSLAFRLNTYGAEQIRNTMLERMCSRKENTSIFVSLKNNNIEVLDCILKGTCGTNQCVRASTLHSIVLSKTQVIAVNTLSSMLAITLYLSQKYKLFATSPRLV